MGAIFSESSLTFIALAAIFAYSFYAVLSAGQLSLGQAGFASLAAFAATALVPAREFGAGALYVQIVIGMVIGALAAIMLGLPTMKLRGVFLAIATLAFGEAVRIIMLNSEWTGGPQGLSVKRTLTPLVAWIIVLLIAYFFFRASGSRYGRSLNAIREDELAARAMGIDVFRTRLWAFISSGAIAGLWGVLTANYMRLIEPNDFDFPNTVNGLVNAVLGGTAMFLGPLFGGAFDTLIPEIQKAVGISAGWLRPFLQSVLLLVVILFLPGGIASLLPRAKAATVGDDVERVPLSRRTHPQPGTTVVALSGLNKDYGGVHAVRDVDLEIDAGDVVGLIGPNGAGKTTLVNMISGLTPPSSGSATVLGHRLGERSMPVHQLAAQGVNRTFQHSKLFARLSVIDNVLVGAHVITKSTLWRRMVFLPSARRDERAALVHAQHCLERVGLGDLARSEAGALSYGDQRRLEIARALASDPTLLILDEPAAGMNHVEADSLSELIRTLAADGLTILLIEHNVGMVLRTCDHVVVLNFGQVIARGTPEEISRNPAVIEAYLGAETEVSHD